MRHTTATATANFPFLSAVAAVAACSEPVPPETPLDAPLPPDAQSPDIDARPDSRTDATPSGRYEFIYRAPSGMRAGNLQGESRLLVPIPGSYRDARLSPDGSAIAYAAYLDGWKLAVRPLAAPNDERVITASVSVMELAWSPDGTRIAFLSVAEPETVGDSALDLRVVDVATGAQLATHYIPGGRGAQPEPFAPDWSPDGTEVAFSDESNILSLVVTTGEVRVLTTTTVSKRRCAPRWSPDGTSLVYTVLPDFGSNDDEAFIERVRAEGGVPVVVTRVHRATWPGQVSWSPDGERLAFVEPLVFASFSLRPKLSVIDSDGGTVLRYDSLDAGVQAGHPTWSPDGQYLLYSHAGDGLWIDAVRVEGGLPLELRLATLGITEPSEWFPQPITF